MIDAVGAAGQFHGGLKAAAVQSAGQRVVQGLVLQGEAFLCFRVDIGDAAHDTGAAPVVHKVAGLDPAPEGGRVSAQQPDFDIRLFRSLLQRMEHLPQLLPVLFMRSFTESFLRRAYGRWRRAVKDCVPERGVGGAVLVDAVFKQNGIGKIGHDPRALLFVGQRGYGAAIEQKAVENERAHGNAESAEKQRRPGFCFLKGLRGVKKGAVSGKQSGHTAIFGVALRGIAAGDRGGGGCLLPLAGLLHVGVEHLQQAVRLDTHEEPAVAGGFSTAGGRRLTAGAGCGFLCYQDITHVVGPFMKIPADLTHAFSPAFLEEREVPCPLADIEGIQQIAENEPCQRQKADGAGFQEGSR